MKKVKFLSILVSIVILLASCGASNTVKGGLIGGGSGAAVGALIGALIGNGKGAAIGASIGAVAGTGAGVIIGKKMDKAAEAAKNIEGATVEQVEVGGVPAVKVTLDGSVTFATGKSLLNQASRNTLATFARNLDPQVDLALYGHTDNTGSLEVNQNLSYARANAVANYLKNSGVTASRIKEVKGFDYQDPIADNTTADGRAKNRRVELYLLASETMINNAQAGK